MSVLKTIYFSSSFNVAESAFQLRLKRRYIQFSLSENMREVEIMQIMHTTVTLKKN